MKREHVEAYLKREWGILAAQGARAWAERKQELGLLDAFRVAEGLRRHAQALHPEWPTKEQRRADFESHLHLSRLLARAGAID